MPLLWKHLLVSYIKAFFLVLLGFAGVGLFLRSKSFITILTSGATPWQSLLSPLTSLLFLLPLLIGLSSLIAAFLTAHRMSVCQEISVLSSYGLSLKQIFAPLLPLSLIFAAINLFLLAEAIPYSKYMIRKIYLTSNTMNPLLLLRKKALPFFTDSYIELDLDAEGKSGKNLSLLYFDEKGEKLSLVTADSLYCDEGDLIGKGYSLLTYLPSSKPTFDHFILTHEKEAFVNGPFFSSFAKKKHRTKTYQLSLKEILQDTSEKGLAKSAKRLSQTLLPLTFALLGISFGLVSPKRKESFSHYFLFGSLILSYFLCHFLAKKISSSYLELFFFLLPHFVLASFSLKRLYAYQRGTL